MADEKQSVGGDAEEEVWIAISAFEQILEAMPNDRASLEALSQAYEQIGDHTRSVDYLVRLGEVLIDEGDGPEAEKLLKRLELYLDEYERAGEMRDAILSMISGDGEGGRGGAGKTSDGEEQEALYASVNMADELAFAWHLMEADLLTQEEYASVVQDLTEMSSGDPNSTVSVLHALEVRGFKGFERLINAVAKEYEMPFVRLSSFSVPNSALDMLPLKFMIRRGAMVFDFVGKDALVVLMNPYDEQLRQQVEALTQRRCHYYLTLPSEYDRVLTELKVARGMEKPQ